MNSILSHIIDLRNDVDVLASNYKVQKEKNTLLNTEKSSLLEKISDLEDEIQTLKQRVEIVDMAKGIAVKDDNSVRFARDRVNTLIRQIDKCISLLNE